MRSGRSILSYLQLLLAATVLPFLGLVGYEYYSTLQAADAQAKATARQFAELAAVETSEFVAQGRHFVEVLSRDPAVRRLDPAGCQDTLQEFHALHPEFAGLMLVDSGDRTICTNLRDPHPEANPSLAGQQWFRRVPEGEPVATARLNGRWVALLAHGVREEYGRLVGSVVLAIDLAGLRLLPAEVEIPQGATATLYASDGTLLARSVQPETWVGANVQGTEIGERVLARTAGTEEYTDIDGIGRLCAFFPVPGTEWMVVAGIPVNVAFADARARALRSGVVLVLVIAAAIGLALLIGRITVRPVRRMAETVRAVARGRLDTRLTPAGPREVAEFAEQFNQILEGRAQTESDLEESRRRLQALFDNTRDGILLVERDARHLDANPALCEMLGYSREEMLGMSLWDDVPEQLRPELQQLWRTFLASGRLEGEFTCLRKDGSTVEVEYRAVAHFLPDLHLCTVRDITVRKRAEQQLQRHTEHLKFLSRRLVEVQENERRILARELHDRTGANLTAVNLHLSMIRDQAPPQATDIRSRVEDAMTLVDATIEAVRDVMADLRPPVLEDYGVLAALRWYGDIFSRQSGLSVTVAGTEPSPRLPPVAETALYRIAQEACTNVAKHASASRVELTLEAGRQGPRLTIADDGRGFDPDAERRPGAGWGLVTMQERAEAVGGVLQVDSAAGRGTRIVVELPGPGDSPAPPAGTRKTPNLRGFAMRPRGHLVMDKVFAPLYT